MLGQTSMCYHTRLVYYYQQQQMIIFSVRDKRLCVTILDWFIIVDNNQ